MTEHTTDRWHATVAHFRELRREGEITGRERDMALKRLAQYGRAWIVRQGIRYTWQDEAIGCDCGKGILCPAVTQRHVGIRAMAR